MLLSKQTIEGLKITGEQVANLLIVTEFIF